MLKPDLYLKEVLDSSYFLLTKRLGSGKIFRNLSVLRIKNLDQLVYLCPDTYQHFVFLIYSFFANKNQPSLRMYQGNFSDQYQTVDR